MTVSRDEETARDGAALGEARTNRSAIVEQAEALMEELRVAAKSSQARLRIEQDEETGDFIYKSIDKETGEILREWPDEDVRRSRALLDRLEGFVLDERA